MPPQNPIDFADWIAGDEVLKAAARSVRSLKNDVGSLGKTVGDDSARIKAGFDAIAAAAKALEDKFPKLRLTDPADAKLLQDYIKEVGSLQKAKENLRKTEEAQVNIQKIIADASKQATTALKEQQAAFKAAVAAGDTEAANRAAAALRNIKTESDQTGKALRGMNSEFTAAKGSYDALVLVNNKLLAELRGLEGGMDATSARALELKKQIAGNTQELKDFDSETNRAFRNVGNYAAGIIEAVKALQSEKTALEAASAALRAQASATGLTADQQNKLQAEIRETDAALGKVNGELRTFGVTAETSGGGLGSLGTKAGGLVAQLGGAYFGIQAIGAAIQGAFTSNSEFASALSSIAALTGATGDDLQFLADKAEELGPTVGKSAAETLKAFELIGSAQPALLKNKEALASVTAEALKLAAASGDELPAAAAALTGIMNQFQAPAEQAARYVNALAAGAKEGAATIPQAADSMRYFGVNAKSANISIEQSVALIQALAERSIKGEQAGVNLRNVFAKLASGAKDTNPEIVGLDKALDNLGKKNLSTAQYTKLFGLENANAARILVESREKVKELTLAVTGTQVANEQAAKQLDNVAQAGNRFLSVAKNLAINLLGPIAKGFAGLLNDLSGIGQRLAGVTKSFDDEVAATGKSIQANAGLARSAQGLMTRYQELTAKGVEPTKGSKQELAQITLQLRDALGESVVSINKETGALELNKEATIELIKQKLLLANQEASSLALRTRTLDEQIKQQEFLNISLKQEADTRAQITGKSAKEAERLNALSIEGSKLRGYDVAAIERQVEADRKLRQGQDIADEARRKRALLLAKLNELGFKEADIQRLFAGATTKAADELKKVPAAADAAKKGLADVMKADLELQKFRLEQQAKDYDRQAENVANSEDVRTRAIEKAVAARQQIAKLDELEQIHAAELKNAKLINGDKALAKERVLLTEQLNAKVAELDFNGRRAIVALRQNAADQLAEIDKQQLDNEAKALEAIGADETKSAAVRQQALLDASARRIEIIQIESDAKRRAAKGDAEVLRKIQAEEDAATTTEAKKTRSPNADLANAELAVKYKLSEIALEKSRQSGLFTERQYYAAVGRLEDAYLEKKLANLKADSTKQQEAADLELFINKRKNELKARDDEKAREKRQRITQQVAEGIEIVESTYFGFKQQRLETEQQQLQEGYDRDIAAAGQNEELKAALAVEFDKKQRALRRKQAELDRESSLFQIAINTAVQASQYTPLNPLFYLAIANGLAQAALVLAKPLPAYFRGREDGPAEFALVAERGPEIIHEKKTGSLRVVAEQGITWLNEGDKVLTAERTREVLAGAGESVAAMQAPAALGASLNRSTVAIQQGRPGAADAQAAEVAAMATALDKNTAVLSKIKVLTVNVNGEVDGAEIRQGNSLVRYRNQRMVNMGRA